MKEEFFKHLQGLLMGEGATRLAYQLVDSEGSDAEASESVLSRVRAILGEVFPPPLDLSDPKVRRLVRDTFLQTIEGVSKDPSISETLGSDQGDELAQRLRQVLKPRSMTRSQLSEKLDEFFSSYSHKDTELASCVSFWITPGADSKERVELLRELLEECFATVEQVAERSSEPLTAEELLIVQRVGGAHSCCQGILDALSDHPELDSPDRLVSHSACLGIYLNELVRFAHTGSLQGKYGKHSEHQASRRKGKSAVTDRMLEEVSRIIKDAATSLNDAAEQVSAGSNVSVSSICRQWKARRPADYQAYRKSRSANPGSA